MSDAAAQPADDTPEQMRIRREKRERLLAEGGEAVPGGRCRAPTRWREIRAKLPGPGSRHRDRRRRSVSSGRVIFVRNTGKLCFATLQEGDGTQLQAMISLAGVGERRAGGVEGRCRPR